jgi:hypothetical protein
MEEKERSVLDIALTCPSTNTSLPVRRLSERFILEARTGELRGRSAATNAFCEPWPPFAPSLQKKTMKRTSTSLLIESKRDAALTSVPAPSWC